MPTDFPVSWQDVHVAAKNLSSLLRPHGSWEKIVAVTRGGLVPACLVARDLDIRTIETISIKSYENQSQSGIEVLKEAADCGDGTGILVIDDLADTGNTFRAIRRILPKATFACLYVKPAGKPTADHFVTEVSQDTWIHLPWEDQDFSPKVRAKIGTHLPE